MQRVDAMNALVTVMLVGLLSVSYIMQNWIMGVLEGSATNPWVVFATLAVVGGLLPFLVFIWGVMLLIRRAER